MFHFRFRLKCGKCAIGTIFAFKLFEFLYFYTTNSRYSSAETNRMIDLPLISPSKKLAPMLCICRRTNCRRDCVGGQSALSSASTLVISLPSRLSLAYTAQRSKHVHFNSCVYFWFRIFLRHTAHNLHLYQSAFFSCITKYTKMMFLTTWNRTSPCISFREQSKRFRGFHSNKIVENTARHDPVLTLRLYCFCHFAVRRSLAHVHERNVTTQCGFVPLTTHIMHSSSMFLLYCYRLLSLIAAQSGHMINNNIHISEMGNWLDIITIRC